MNRIAKLRKQKNLSQEDLAKELNIAQNTLSQYENERRRPTSRIILCIANYFGVTPNYVLGLPEETPSANNLSLKDAASIVRTSEVTDANLYIKLGWKLIHVGVDAELSLDGSGYSTIYYTLGWFGSPEKMPQFEPEQAGDEYRKNWA